jgi:hypothetical protein
MLADENGILLFWGSGRPKDKRLAGLSSKK